MNTADFRAYAWNPVGHLEFEWDYVILFQPILIYNLLRPPQNIINSRVSGWGYKIGAVCVCACLSVCLCVRVWVTLPLQFNTPLRLNMRSLPMKSWIMRTSTNRFGTLEVQQDFGVLFFVG